MLENVGLHVTKMSGAGNDFVVIEAAEAARLGDGLVSWIRAVCRRGLSVGSDGVLIVSPREDGTVAARFHNPDGGEAFCGNATRCAARFARLRGWAGDSMTLDTAAGAVAAEVHDDRVAVSLAPPEDRGVVELHTRRGVQVGRHIVAGVPHFILHALDLDTVAIGEIAPEIRRHAHFGAAGTNVDFVAWRRDGALGIRTWERGVEGETLSCGSGAVAAAWAAHRDTGRAEVRVVPASGVPLRVAFPGPPEHPFAAVLEGDARVVFDGTLTPEAVTGFEAR